MDPPSKSPAKEAPPLPTPPLPAPSPPTTTTNAPAHAAAAADPHHNRSRNALANDTRKELWLLYQSAGLTFRNVSSDNILRKSRDYHFRGHEALERGKNFWKLPAATKREILAAARGGRIRVEVGPSPFLSGDKADIEGGEENGTDVPGGGGGKTDGVGETRRGGGKEVGLAVEDLIDVERWRESLDAGANGGLGDAKRIHQAEGRGRKRGVEEDGGVDARGTTTTAANTKKKPKLDILPPPPLPPPPPPPPPPPRTTPSINPLATPADVFTTTDQPTTHLHTAALNRATSRIRAAIRDLDEEVLRTTTHPSTHPSNHPSDQTTKNPATADTESLIKRPLDTQTEDAVLQLEAVLRRRVVNLSSNHSSNHSSIGQNGNENLSKMGQLGSNRTF